MTKRKMIERPPGRPPVSKDEGPSAVLRARVGTERVAKVKRLGGAAWLRKTIDKAPEPKAIDKAKDPLASRDQQKENE